jgi:hypothetical protein
VTLFALAGSASAQDFLSPAPAGPGALPCGFLEEGLPPASASLALEAAATRWFALPGLETRALGAAAGWRLVRLAAGLSQTGEPDIGWSAAGLALGVAHPLGGAGLRAVARRDRAIEPGSAAALRLAARAGVEVGGGAWLEAAEGLRIWAAVPQAWAEGVAPPLERPLEVGAIYEREGLACWLTRAAPATEDPPDHGAGAALRSGPLQVWGAVRDRPLRGGFGLSLRARRLVVAAQVESHPDLGETVRLALGIAGSGS